MKPDHFDQVMAAFNLILDHKVEDRAGMIEDLRAQDPELCAEVEKLLQQSAATWNFGQNQSATPEQTIGTGADLLQERYRLDRKLGQGGFGIVYLAYDERLHRKPVVVKFLTRATRGDEWFHKKFEDEIEALARIDHPGVVGILDAGKTSRGTPFLVMQYAEGVSLRSLICPNGIDPVQTAGIIRQIGQALAAAHSRGVLHRDLKPENIMVQQTPRGELVRLIDFGIATVRAGLRTFGDPTRVAGTPSYMAPEQLHGHPTAASDIFAMGVIAWEMLFGESPFARRETDRKLERPAAIIRKSLALEPAERPQNAAVFGDELSSELTRAAAELKPVVEQSTETIHITAKQWERVLQIFQQALKKPRAERSAFVRAAGSEPTLRAEVERLLLEYDKSEHDKAEDGETAPREQPPRERPVMFSGGEMLMDRFRIERLLGVGGMGEVYEATDLVLREALALKTVRFDVAADELTRARFAQEVYAARKVAHPNICRIHDLHRHQSVLFLTMELVRGETLEARLRRTGPMNLEDARLIAGQLSAALMAAHVAGVIHRDFKSANVILAASPDRVMRAVVTDFGLARSVPGGVRSDSITETGKAVGTPAYMAPEQLLGGPITPAVDIYAFGVVLYEMVTGTQPFAGESRFAAAVKRITNQPPSPRIRRPDLPVQWERAILGCLEREPGNRTARALDVWTAITADVPAQGPAAIAGARAAKPRIRAAAASVAGAVLLVGGLTGAWFLGRHRPPVDAVRWYEDGTRALRDGLSFTAMNALERAVKIDPEFTLAHARLAEAATELDYMDKAKTEMLRASPPALQSFFLSSEERLRLEAIYLVLIKDFDRAATKYRELMAKVGSAEQAAVLVDLGRAYEGGGKFPEALASYSESIERDRQFAAAFLHRAVLEGHQQVNAKANADFDAAEQLYRTEGMAEGMIEVLYQRSSLLRRMRRFAEARVPSQTAFDMARASGDDYHQIKALLALSELSTTSGDTDDGQRKAQQATDLAHQAGIEVLAASGLADIGNALFIKGDDAGAEPYLRSAIESAKRLGAARTEARAQVALGQVLAKEGRAPDALAMLKQATESFLQSGEKSNAALAAIPGARLLRDRGDYEAAAGVFRHLLQVAQEVKDDGGIIYAMQGLGTVQLMQEQYPAALASFERSAVVSHAIANQSLEAYNEVYNADTLWRLGRYSEADDYLKSAAQRLNGNKPLLASVYTARAGMDLSRRRFAEAEEDIRKMMDAAGPNAQMVLTKRLSGLIRVSTGRVREGRTMCEESVRLAQSAPEIAPLRNSELALAEARLDSGDAAGALALVSTLLPYYAAQGQFESELRVLSIAFSASRDPDRTRYSASAKQTLDKLRQSLGAEIFTGFESRPDIRQIIQRAGIDY